MAVEYQVVVDEECSRKRNASVAWCWTASIWLSGSLRNGGRSVRAAGVCAGCILEAEVWKASMGRPGEVWWAEDEEESVAGDTVDAGGGARTRG